MTGARRKRALPLVDRRLALVRDPDPLGSGKRNVGRMLNLLYDESDPQSDQVQREGQ
jgi:hypothetical protein